MDIKKEYRKVLLLPLLSCDMQLFVNQKEPWYNFIYADDSTLYSKCDKASVLWQQLELNAELESDLRDTVD